MFNLQVIEAFLDIEQMSHIPQDGRRSTMSRLVWPNSKVCGGPGCWDIQVANHQSLVNQIWKGKQWTNQAWWLNPCISGSFGLSDLMKIYYRYSDIIDGLCLIFAWSFSGHFIRTSNWSAEWMVLKKRRGGWVGLPIYHHVPRSLQLYMAHALGPRMKVCQGPTKPNGNSAMYFCRGCAHYATNHDFHDSQTLRKPWLLLRDSRCRTNVGKRQHTTMTLLYIWFYANCLILFFESSKSQHLYGHYISLPSHWPPRDQMMPSWNVPALAFTWGGTRLGESGGVVSALVGV